MKRKLYSNICLWCFVVMALCACGKQKQGNPIVLPDREEVISIGVSDGERTGLSPNTEEEADAFIDEFLSILMDMETTNKESITDTPTNKDYITINLYCDDKTTTFYYYKDKKTEYVEQPYQGIYIPAPTLGFYITQMLDSADNEAKVRPVDGSLALAVTEPSLVKTYEVTDSDTAFENDELVTMVQYYEMSDGTWKTDTHTYEYRLEITGRMNGAKKDSTFVFLSNTENITFEQAWKAAGLSSNMNDYFNAEDAKFVAMK